METFELCLFDTSLFHQPLKSSVQIHRLGKVAFFIRYQRRLLSEIYLFLKQTDHLDRSVIQRDIPQACLAFRRAYLNILTDPDIHTVPAEVFFD